MLELDNARYFLVCSIPQTWHSSARVSFEAELWELIGELRQIRESLWL